MEHALNKDQVEGRATQVKGKVKEAAGKVTDSKRLERDAVERYVDQHEALAGMKDALVAAALDLDDALGHPGQTPLD